MCLGMALLIVCSCTKEEGNGPSTDKNGPITLELADQTATTAVFKGSVNLDLYSKYDEVGIIYSLSEDMEIEPLITNVIPITNIDKNNRFEKKMRSLLYGTKYYYSSYICMNGIYKFGEIQSFTTDDVEMQVSAPTVTSTTATFKGKVEIAEDDMESLSFGIAWSTGSDFEMNVNEDTAELEEDGTFTLTVSDLKMDTEYHYATCIRQVGSQYGEVKKFVTTAVSMTASATKVTQTTVTFTGQAERNKADDSIEYGILYSTGTNLKVGASGCTRKTLTDAFDSNGKYSLKVTGLSNDTKYNYCWYARQGSNYKYGPVQQFTTFSVTINLSVTSITQTTATFTGDYEQPDGSGIEIGVLYSLSSSALKADSDAVEKIKLTNKTFRQKVSDLKYNTTYYYCTYVYQSGTYKYGSVQNFKTNNVTVEVSVGDITQTTATFSGKTEITESDAIEVGILYSTSSSLSPTSSSTTKKVLGNGSFSFKVEDLRNNTRYYYQYYIKQDGKYVYGERQNFMTSSITASLSEPVVTQTTATFSGNVNLAETSEIEFGILYSTSDRLTATASGVNRVTVTSLDNGAFSCKAEGLQHSTKYYYCYYACQDGSYTYGSVSELTTSTVNVNLSVGSTPTSVIFNGNVELTEEGIIEVGVLYSRYQSLSANGVLVTKQAIVPDSSGEFSFKAEDLLFETTYYFCYYVCQGGKYTYGPSQTLFTTSSVKVNLSVESTTQTTTTFKGNIEQADDGDVEVGILYSTGTYLKVGASNVIQQTLSPDSSGMVACTISGLQFATTYNYCYYICHNGKYGYGSTQTFTTSSPNMTLSVDSITQTTATFNGNVELTEGGLIEVGVLYSTGENLTVNASGVTKKVLTPDSSGHVSGKAEGLQFNTPYNYCYYICQNGKYTYGGNMLFTTLDIVAQDLSLSGTANCYIISESGTYKIKTVKGNSNENVGEIVSSEILWESFGTDVRPNVGDLITWALCNKIEIVFEVPLNFKEGNAVIAAKDANGNILWSWHIWLTDQPQAQVYKNDAGTMMDRNLGSTSATKGDVGALGLLYQWGRKDPFLGSSSISSNTIAKSTIAWPSTVSSDSSNGTIEYAIAHPTTFITCNSENYDWYYTGDSSTDNTRWTTSSNDKSIYDPCPAGWRVPDGGSNGIWSKAGFDRTTYDSTNEGISFSISSPSTTWHPASGCCGYYGVGGLDFVGGLGSYWSASPIGYYAYYLYFSSDGRVYPSDYDIRARGYSVRCLQESK